MSQSPQPETPDAPTAEQTEARQETRRSRRAQAAAGAQSAAIAQSAASAQSGARAQTTAGAQAGTNQTKKGPWLSPLRRQRITIALIGLLSVGIMLYPTIASWFSALQQTQIIQQQSAELSRLDQATLDAEFDDAVNYNHDLTNTVAVDPFSVRVADEKSAGYTDYLSQLSSSSTGVMARIRIPAISADLPIYHGTNMRTLERGIGHLYGTALPVGGESTHSVLTGHSGIPEAELFSNLHRVQVGDSIIIEAAGQRLHYRVNDIRVVDPTDTESLNVRPGEDLLTLVTCTPIGLNTQRLLVTGERAPLDEIQPDPDTLPENVPFPWWTVWVAAVTLVVAAYIATTPRNPGRHAKSAGEKTEKTPVTAGSDTAE